MYAKKFTSTTGIEIELSITKECDYMEPATKNKDDSNSKWGSLVNSIENDEFYSSKNVRDFSKELKEIHSEVNEDLFSEN